MINECKLMFTDGSSHLMSVYHCCWLIMFTYWSLLNACYPKRSLPQKWCFCGWPPCCFACLLHFILGRAGEIHRHSVHALLVLFLKARRVVLVIWGSHFSFKQAVLSCTMIFFNDISCLLCYSSTSSKNLLHLLLFFSWCLSLWSS